MSKNLEDKIRADIMRDIKAYIDEFDVVGYMERYDLKGNVKRMIEDQIYTQMKDSIDRSIYREIQKKQPIYDTFIVSKVTDFMNKLDLFMKGADI